MKRGARAILLATAAVGAFVAASPAAQADPAVAGVFPLPGVLEVSSNNELIAGPDGNIWVTTTATDKIVQMSPAGTAVAHTLLGMTKTISGITVGSDGKLYGAQGTGYIVIDPANPTAGTQVSIAGLTNAEGITTGADGNVWLAGANNLVSIPPSAPTTFTPHAVALANGSKGMATGSDGLLWIATGTGKVVSATASAAPALTPYDVGATAATGGTQDVAAGLNGQVGWVNPVDSPMSVGTISPGGTPNRIELPNTDPFGITFGNDGAYWISRASGNDLLRMTPDGTTTTLTGFPPSALGPRKITTGPDNTLWTTLDLADDVAKVTGVTPPPTPEPGPDPTPTPTPATPPETTIVKAPDKKVEAKEKTGKAKVKIFFSATGTAPSFQCTLTEKGEKPKTKACTSPAKYKLKPAKYTFAVVATADNLVDESPATAKFKVVEP